MNVDFLIVGQGVAGSALAWTLDQRGCSVVLADDPALPTASTVAAGIVNPLTGRKLVRTWKADELFPFLHAFYTQIEQELGVTFFQSKNIYRPFRSLDEKTAYLTYVSEPDIQPYVEKVADDQAYSPFIANPFGGIEVTQAGWLDLTEFVRIIKGYFIKKNQYFEGRILPQDLAISDNKVEWQGLNIGKVLFCDGVQARENPLFDWLPYNPVKGQVLTAVAENYSIKNIVNQGVFILPVREGLLKIGATYTWHDLDWQTTDDGREFLESKVQQILKVPYRVVAQQAGIRPSTKDRRPFIGLHPLHPSVGIFGGMGTKGVSLAPYLAEQFARYLLDGEDLEPEANISRCVSLLSRSE
ncbi:MULTISPECIES: FAD-dependent oxidoreductase [unclassified Spirosoma]|uniref:NAD(P)/FAD-dependent oxidoreductase n=1 Tax=unclassified Spirosoma TaxID=2621999 RepID=UPI000959E53E|nr:MULTISPECIES: FAD-dependent oxidoreductase [unclassified Spirosoma]MBN8823373.1 FAD-binding oxidoreductase [Spirosoma sp.]OJW72007.1 MAG: FAD-dependent oxidoreductase [Spirosoma sp. 48-14]